CNAGDEPKAAAPLAGARPTKPRLHAGTVACQVASDNGSGPRIDANPKTNAALRSALHEARAAMAPEAYIQKVLQLAAQGVTDFHFPEYDTDWDSEAYLTVAGQNSNNSVRVPNHFFEVLE